MEKPENIAACNFCAGIHLSCPTGSTFQNSISKFAAKIDGPVTAVAIDNDDLSVRRGRTQMLKKLANERGFVQHRHDD